MPENKRGRNVSAYLTAERTARFEKYKKDNKIKKDNAVVLKAIDLLLEPLTAKATDKD